MAFVEVHVRVLVPPATTVCGLAIKVTVAAGATTTVTAAGELVPPGPLQVREKVVLVVRAAVIWLPLGDKAPVQPSEPVQAVALVEVHVRVVVPPLPTVVAAALIDATGGA